MPIRDEPQPRAQEGEVLKLVAHVVSGALEECALSVVLPVVSATSFRHRPENAPGMPARNVC